MKLEVNNLSYSIDNEKLLHDISIKIKEGEFVGIVGPNGCGKSTLLKNIYRVYRPKFGDIFIDGEEIQKLSSRKIARKMAVMVQENNVEFDISVLNMVLLGRYAHKKILEDDSPKDIEIARESLKKVGLEKYEDRSFLSLSGGEKQRVLIARVDSTAVKIYNIGRAYKSS